MKPSKLGEGKQLRRDDPSSHNNLDITFLLEAVPSGMAQGGSDVSFYEFFSTCNTDHGWLCHSSRAPRPRGVPLITAQISLSDRHRQHPRTHKPGASLKLGLRFH